MASERNQQVQEALRQALAQPIDLRSAYLDEALAGDPDLRSTVDALLCSHSEGTISGSVDRTSDGRPFHPAHGPATGPGAGDLIGSYRVQRELGCGGMGTVLLAEDTRLGRLVALKLLRADISDPRSLRRFAHEPVAASALNHPNIVTVYDVGDSECGRFIAMEFVEGQTLRTLLPAGVGVASARNIGRQVSTALAVAHAAGIVHRDIKPENIMVRPDGYVKVVDFGLARRVGCDTLTTIDTLEHTSRGTLIGTIRYMSPEQTLGKAVGPTSDVFSLGVVLYELVTGRHPFAADSVPGSLHAIAYEEPVRSERVNPEIDARFADLIVRMLAKDQHARPSAAAVRDELSEPSDGEAAASRGAPGASATAVGAVSRITVGRTRERNQLEAALTAASEVRGLLLGVAGEPGVGKTTLVEEFLSVLLASGRPCAIGRGRCSERLAGAEAYLPVIEAIDALLRGPGGDTITRALRTLAPTWYVQVQPASEPSADRLLDDLHSASQQRMKRELIAFFEEVQQRRTIVLFFDDLHWADASTIDLIGYLAMRFESLRMLVIGTYRPSDLAVAHHPFLQLKLDLSARGLCRELVPGALRQEEIAEYIAIQFPGHRLPSEFVAMIHEKTEGNPLFMSDVLRDLRDRQVLAKTNGWWTLTRSVPDIAAELPESIRSMIQRKIERVGEANRTLLLAASVQGYSFDSAVIARATGVDLIEVEERLQVVEATHLLVRAVGEYEFPDRTLTAQYRFSHALYHDALFRTLTPARRSSLARAVSQSMLAFYGEQGARPIAAPLALLFEVARDFDQAVRYFLMAADNAAQLFAHHESASLARKAASLISTLPPNAVRQADELAARMTLGVALMATQGFSAPEVEQTFRRARQLCEELGTGPHLFRALWGLWTVHVIRAEFQTAQVLADQMMNAAATSPDLLMPASYAQAMTSDYVGDHRTARANYQQLIALYDPQRHRSHIHLYGLDLKSVALARLCWVTWALGYPDAARGLLEECVMFARQVGHPYSTACALLTTPQLCWDFDEPQRAQQLAEETMALSSEQGFPLSLAYATVHHAWAIARQGRLDEGLDEMRRSFAMLHAMGAEMSWTGYQVSMAEVLGDAGRLAEGIELANQGLARAELLGEGFFEAELYRVRADLRWKVKEQDPAPDVEQDYARALTLARARGSKSHELRAAMSLARLQQHRGQPGRARDLLRPLVSWFTEGQDSPDLRRASALLADLEHTAEP